MGGGEGGRGWKVAKSCWEVTSERLGMRWLRGEEWKMRDGDGWMKE